MKFVIAQESFLESLKIVSRAVSGANSLPVLGNILIRAEGKKVHFSATNLEISISTFSEATVKNEGAVTVPAKILTSYVSLLSKADEMEISASGGNTLEIRSKTSQTKIKGISADEFPSLAKVEGGTKLEIPADVFRSSVQKVAFAAQEHSSRPILSGVYFSANKSELRMAATDSYRLSEKIIALKTEAKEVTCVVPVRAVLEADRLAGGNNTVTVTVTDNQVLFVVGRTELISRLIEGQFPDYKQIIPKNVVSTVEISREEFDLAVRRVSIFAKENNQHMKLEFLSDNSLVLSTDATEVGEEKTKISVKLTGQPNTIALNSDYVLDAVGALSGDEKIKIELEGKANPAIIRPVKDKDFIHLIMPLKM